MGVCHFSRFYHNYFTNQRIMGEQKITSIMIIEVAGRPPEYLTNSMKLHIDKLNNIKGVSLNSSKISEPTLIESEKDLYSCFAEVEIDTENLAKLMDLIFDFMPSSVEIIEPTNLDLNCQEATMFANDLAGRLHRYDEVAKIAQFQIHQLTAKIAQMQQGAQPRPAQNPIQPIKITMNQDDSPKESKKVAKKPIKKKNKK